MRRKSRDGLTCVERVRELLDYDPQSGVFIWKVFRGGSAPQVGEVAGAAKPNGHILIGVDGVRFQAHRLAWLHYYGRWPTGVVDHINGNGGDNRIENLRETNQAFNALNQKRKSTATNKYCGVTYVARRNKWRARFRDKQLGLFLSEETAYQCYLSALRDAVKGAPIPMHPSFRDL